MKSKLMHNLLLKIMAVLFAVLLWMISMDINNPVEEKKIYNVEVALVNTGSITGQNKTYKVVDNSDVIRVTVRAQKTVLGEISRENIIARADCSKVGKDGTIPIELSLNDKYLDNKIDSIQKDSEAVQLEIENKITKQLKIEVVKKGSLPEGYAPGKVSTETNMMSISGPESAIETVAKAMVEVSMDNVTSDINMLANIRLLDQDGNEISNNSIRKSIENVTVAVQVLRTKEVPLSWEVYGVPADGYAVTGGVTATPEKLLIAGRENVLANVESIAIASEELDVTDAKESLSAQVDVRKYLPADVSLVNQDDANVTIVVEVEPIRRKTINIAESAVQMINVPQGWQAEILPNQNLQLVITGLQRNLNTVDETTVIPHVDISALQDELGNMPAGEMEAEVKVLIPSSVKQEGTVSAIVRLTKNAEE